MSLKLFELDPKYQAFESGVVKCPRTDLTVAAFCPHESGAALALTSGDGRAQEDTIDTMRQ